LLPLGSEKDDDETGDHPDEVTPAGGDTSVDDGEQIFGIGENENEEGDREDDAKGAQPGRDGGARAKEESDGKNDITGKVNEENLAEEGGLILVPARGGVEEVEIESDGKDSDLEKIEKANGVDAGGVLLRKRKEDHENRSGPDEEENVGWPRILSRAGNKTLVIGADDLSESFECKGDGEEEPELAGVAGGAAGGVEGTDCGEKDHGRVQGIGGEKAGHGGTNEFEVEDEEQRNEESGCDSEPRKLAGGKQGDLTRRNCTKSRRVYNRREGS